MERMSAPLLNESPPPNVAVPATGDSRAEQVRTLFDRLAGRYDRLNDWMTFGLHRAWKRRAVAALQLPQGGRALDICTGTGDLIFNLLEAVGPAGRVDGLDFSAPMLPVAEERLKV